MDSFLNVYFLFQCFMFKNIWNTVDFSRCKNGHLKWKVPDHQWLLWDFNPLLNKSSGFLQHTGGQVCSHIWYERAASTFSITELVPKDAQVTGRGKCANAELGHYTMQNNPDNYNFIIPPWMPTLIYKINHFYIAYLLLGVRTNFIFFENGWK